jgi:hypothetical protein
MPKHRSWLIRAAVPLLLLLFLGACSAGRPNGAPAPGPAGAGSDPALTVPTWPADGRGLGDPNATWGAATDPVAQPSTAPDQEAGAGPTAAGQPAPGPTSAGGTSAGGSAASERTVTALSEQADRALQEFDAALSDDAAAPTDEGGLP